MSLHSSALCCVCAPRRPTPRRKHSQRLHKAPSSPPFPTPQPCIGHPALRSSIRDEMLRRSSNSNFVKELKITLLKSRSATKGVDGQSADVQADNLAFPNPSMIQIEAEGFGRCPYQRPSHLPELLPVGRSTSHRMRFLLQPNLKAWFAVQTEADPGPRGTSCGPVVSFRT